MMTWNTVSIMTFHFSLQLCYTQVCTSFGVSQVVCMCSSTCLCLGPRGCFRSECFTGGKLVAALRLNRFLVHINTHPNPIHKCQARGWTGRKYCFSSIWHNLTVNWTQPTCLYGACSTQCNFSPVIIHSYKSISWFKFYRYKFFFKL